MMLGLAWLYVEYGTRPRFESALAGISAVVVVLIVQAILQLSRSSLRSAATIAIAVGGAPRGAIVSVHELAILVGGGLADVPRVAVPAAGRHARAERVPAWCWVPWSTTSAR